MPNDLKKLMEIIAHGRKAWAETIHRYFESFKGKKEKAFVGLTGASRRTRINLPNGDWIEVEENEPGVFSFVGDSEGATWEESEEGNSLGYCEWDAEVEDLDAGKSDASSCFGISCHLKWRDVEFRPWRILAPSIERLKEALDHVTFCVWSRADV